MKAFLFLCILISLNCNIIDTSICLIKNDKLRAIVIETLTAIKEKNWINIISTVLSKFEEVKSIVLKCLEPEPEPIPQPPSKDEDACEEECQDLVEYHEREECYKDCFFRRY